MRNIEKIVGIILVALALIVLVVLLGGAGMMGVGEFNTGVGMIGPGMMGGYNLFGWTVPPVFWALLIGVFGLLVLGLARGGARQALIRAPAGTSALDILQARYARGEITQEQFSEMRKNLVGG
ncbi:MAG: SHOCT domain-containing protein [Anaerolineae bacterium]